MSIPSEATLEEEEDDEEEPQQERNPEPSHHPTAPSDEVTLNLYVYAYTCSCIIRVSDFP